MHEHANTWAKALRDGTAAPASGHAQAQDAPAADVLELVQTRVKRHSPDAFARFVAKKNAVAEAQAQARQNRPGAEHGSAPRMSSAQRRGLTICNGGRAR
jgi:hypothetical protein